MPSDARLAVLLVGALIGAGLLAALLWSIRHPERRLWPPNEATPAIKATVWSATIAIFASALLLGMLDWNSFGWPASLRWSLGSALILSGNLVVWAGVLKIGMKATSGERDTLKTDGLYAWSRNPQYVADIAIFCGLAVLSASAWTLPVILLGISCLAIAPFAEEPWLEGTYGEPYRRYRRRVGRYF